MPQTLGEGCARPKVPPEHVHDHDDDHDDHDLDADHDDVDEGGSNDDDDKVSITRPMDCGSDCSSTVGLVVTLLREVRPGNDTQ